MPGPKETAYDEKIAPLISQICDLCKQHKINMAAQFALDDIDGSQVLAYEVLSSVDPDDHNGHKRMIKVAIAMEVI
jgi:hypothetical protein